MTIEAQLFDGTILQFPDDTDRSVIDSTVKKLTAERQQAEPEEKQSRLREVADVPLSVGKGAVQGVRFIADAFGAENPISKNLRGVEDYLGGLMSAQAKNDQQEIARIMKDAEDKGVLEQVKAGIKAFTVAPVDLLSQAFGTIAPVVVGGLAGGALRLGATATGLATGATMGAGSIKGGIYDAVKEELSKTNLPPDQIEQRAILAQEYGGENLDQILLGAGIGGLSAITGAEAALVPAMARRIAAKAAQKSTTARAIGTGGKEFFTEGLQGGQEQVSQNVALQREGYDVPTYQGAVGAGTLEGLAGLGMGTAVGAFSRPQAPYVPPEPTPEIAPEAPAEIAPEAPILTQAPAAPLTPEQERQLAIDQQIARQNAFQAQFGEPAVATETPQQAYERQMAQQAQRTPVRPVTEPQPISPFLGVGEAAIQPGQRERAQGLAAQEFGLNVGQARPQVTEQDRIARQLAAQREMDADRFQQQSPLPPVTPAQAQPRTPAPIPSARAIDRQAELLGQREGLPAIEQAGLSAQADIAGGTGQVAVPQTRFVDLTPMPPRAARQKLAALKADAPDADLNIVPHPEMSGRFAIEERVAPAPEAPAISPTFSMPRTGVSYDQAMNMARNLGTDGVLTPEVVAAAEQYGLNLDPMLMQFAERTTPENPLVQQRRGMADEAALNAELRGGIATPEEAQRLREVGMGRPYDEVASLEPRAPAELGKGERQRRLEEEALAERDAAIREHFKNLQGPELWLEGFELGLNPKSAIQTASPKFKEIFLKPEGRYSLVTTATPEARAAVEDFLKEAMPMLKRFGLEKVGLRLVDSIKNGEAEGMYAQQIITIALDSDNPLGVMRHEVIHALKELGAFTPAEWKVLSKAAKDKWIDQFFSPELQQQYKDVYLEHNGDLNGFDAYMQEEAIAQAFRFYTETKPPAGRIANIMRRLNEFFAALRNFLNGRGFQNIDEMFLPNRILADIERGAITPGRERGRVEEVPKYSLRSHAVEIVSNDIAKPEIEGKVTVDKVGQYFDNKVLSEFDRKLDYKNDEDFARAVAQADDEIAFQLAQENSGLDWYEEDVKKAFEYTAQVIPELNSEQKRLLFSVMAGIMSPQTNARDNWFIAAKAFQHYVATNTIPGTNPDTGGLWQGGTQSANKKVQLEFLNKMVADLGERQALEWLTGQHSVKEVNEFRQKYGNIKSGIGGKATDQVIGLYAFGPKVGPFVSNLNGIHDVTVDKWMTRTFNRYFGTMVDADGKIIDAPTEPQRKAVKQLVNEAAQNANIKPYQVQSLLWFFEQRLFRELGTPAPSYGFSDGGRKFLESATGGDEKGRRGASAQAPKFSLKAPTTPEFKRFFGNSKITNPDGTPKVMYHGTARVIDEFIPKQAGAIFVTDNPEFAGKFSEDSANYKVLEQIDKLAEAYGEMDTEDQVNFLKKAYRLGAKNNIISKAVAKSHILTLDYEREMGRFSTLDEVWSYFRFASEFLSDSIRKEIESGENIMPLYVRAENPFDFENPAHVEQVYRRLFDRFGEDIAFFKERLATGDWPAIEDEAVQEIIKDLGHDSFYIKEGGEKNLAVYNPNQVKSATGNRGTYDETGRILYSLKNAPPNRYTKLAPDDPTAGKAVIDAATSAFNAVRNDGTRTSARINLVDRFSGLSRTLESIPLFSDGKLRADMLHHAKAQGINLIKGGLLSGTPILNDDGTIGIERSENNLARAAYVADSINSNKNVIDSGLSGRALIGEVARILRGADILAEDAELRKLGEQQLREADAMAAQLKAEKNQMSARQIADMQKEIDSKRAEGNANRKMNRELQVKPEDIAWAKKQLDLIPEVQEVLDIWKNVNTSLVNLWEATGLLDKETADKYRAAKNYVPLFKSREDLNEESFFQTGSGAKTTAKVKKLEGADITRNIWENVDKQYAVMIAAAYENQTRRASVEQMRGIDPKLAEITNASDPRVNLRYRDGGKDVHVVIENPNDLAAFQSMSYQLSPIMKFLGGFTNVLRAGALLNPMFWIRQLIRDPIHASIAGQSGIITPVHSAAEFLRIITQNSEEARILASRGVIGQFDSTVSLNEFLGEVGKDKQKPPGAVQRGLHKLMQIHEASDAATRVAIFKKAKAKALKDGMSEAQAIDYAVFKARESINFALTGNSPTLANVRHMIPFLNATIVGLDTLYRAATGYGLNPEEKAQARRMFRNRAMMLTAMSFAYAMSMQDDDDYKKLPDYVKDGNWLIPTSTDAGKTFVKVSVPYEVGFLFKTLPELFVRYMAGTSTGKETLAAFRTGLIHNMPTGGVPIPQFAKPALEVVTNYSFFTNRPIEGLGDSRLPVAQRGQKASEFAKMMSSLGLDEFGLSPAKIDALSKGYFAEFGTFFNELTDALIIAGSGGQKTPRNKENLPFMKAFLTDPLVNKAIGDFYQIETSATETANQFTKYKNEGQGEQLREMIADPDKAKQVQGAPVLRQISKSMSDIQKAIRIIDANKSIDPEERRERINQLQAQLGQLAERGRQVADSIGLSR